MLKHLKVTCLRQRRQQGNPTFTIPFFPWKFSSFFLNVSLFIAVLQCVQSCFSVLSTTQVYMSYNIFSMYYSFKMFRVFDVASIPRLINCNHPALIILGNIQTIRILVSKQRHGSLLHQLFTREWILKTWNSLHLHEVEKGKGLTETERTKCKILLDKCNLLFLPAKKHLFTSLAKKRREPGNRR